MSRFLLVIAAAISLFSCQNKKEDAFTHLPYKQMEKVLLDVHMAESYSMSLIDSTHKVGEKNTDSLAVYYKAIFAKHGITAAQFNQSLTWYKHHPGDFDSVYSNMIATAAKMQANMLPAAVPLPPPPPAPAQENKP